jgi:hypothetical protein
MNAVPERYRTALSRMAAVLLLLCTLAGASAIIFVPVWRLHQHYDKFIEEYGDRLQRYRRIIALRTDIDGAVEAATNASGGRYYLNSATINLAAAELQTLVTRTVEKSNGRVLSSQIQPIPEDGKSKDSKEPQKVRISIQLSAATTPLQLILHTLETHTPYLFIESASVSSRYGRGYRPEPGIQPEIDVNLVVSAYLRPGGGTP